MEVLLVHNFSINSHSGPYHVIFDNKLVGRETLNELGTHYVIDKNVLPVLGKNFCKNKKVVLIDALEETKSYQGVGPVISTLLELGLKRDSVLVAIGGGITQDITCFIATTFMRGIKWIFVPTTLLAQADSCIGSKSSINFDSYKNLLGSFNPPNYVYLSNQFLDTLDDKDFKSGIGEIIKLYLIDKKYIHPKDITRDNIHEYIFGCLQIKKAFIELDEYDKGIRNILNYGHCFGHGIESATNFIIPHGIAITIGMDVANRLSYNLGFIGESKYLFLHEVLELNYRDFKEVPIDSNIVLKSLSKDKKNTGNNINIVLPVGSDIKKHSFSNFEDFWQLAQKSLEEITLTKHST